MLEIQILLFIRKILLLKISVFLFTRGKLNIKARNAANNLKVICKYFNISRSLIFHSTIKVVVLNIEYFSLLFENTPLNYFNLAPDCNCNGDKSPKSK